MDVLAQALSVAEQAEASSEAVTLHFDLSTPSHRAAYAAALAVLRISGVDEDALIQQIDPPAAFVGPRLLDPTFESAAVGTEGTDPLDGNPVQIAQLRKEYLEALTDMSPDESRRETVARETFPRIVSLLQDGANIEAVAQIQYRRWVEDHLDAVR